MSIVTASRVFKVDVSPNTSEYASGDQLGDKFSLVGSVTHKGSTGIIQSVILSDQTEQNAAIDVIFFDQDFTEAADNAAMAISHADAKNCLGSISLAAADYKDIGGSTVVTKVNAGLGFQCNNSTTLYGVCVSRGTPTYAAITDLQLIITVLMDT